MIKLTKKQASIIKDEFWKMHEDKSFPVFDTDKRVDIFEFYPCFTYSKVKTYTAYVKVSDIVGDNWAFDKKEDRGRYPAVNKLTDIVDYHAGVLKHGNKDIPPVPMYKVKDMYHLGEGNHRLYTLKYLESKGLVKDPVIKARIDEYDYDNFLKESEVIKRNDGLYLLYDKIYLERMSDKEAQRFLELKNEL